ncbi:hypothetical protein [Clostridium amylolyticum]
MNVITAVTVQNTQGAFDVQDIEQFTQDSFNIVSLKRILCIR